MDENLGAKTAEDLSKQSQYPDGGSVAVAPEPKTLPLSDAAQPDLDPEQVKFLEKLAAGRLTPDDIRKIMPAELDGNKLTVALDGNGNKAVIHELGGQESLIADKMIGDSTNTDLKYKTYALVGLDKLVFGGQEVVLPPPTSDFAVGRRAAAFKHSRHLMQLARAYSLYFDTPMSEGELKNA